MAGQAGDSVHVAERMLITARTLDANDPCAGGTGNLWNEKWNIDLPLSGSFCIGND